MIAPGIPLEQQPLRHARWEIALTPSVGGKEAVLGPGQRIGAVALSISESCNQADMLTIAVNALVYPKSFHETEPELSAVTGRMAANVRFSD